MYNRNVQQNPLLAEPCVFTCQSCRFFVHSLQCRRLRRCISICLLLLPSSPCFRVSNGYEMYAQCNRLLYARCSKNYRKHRPRNRTHAVLRQINPVPNIRSKKYRILSTPRGYKEVPKWHSDWSMCTVFDTPEPKFIHLPD